MSEPAPTNCTYDADTLAIFAQLKSMIISNARLLHGTSKNGRPRAYDITTSAKSRTRVEHRASLVVYDETYKSQEKIDVSSKVLKKSPSKLSLNLAMEELLRKMEEELWVDNVTK